MRIALFGKYFNSEFLPIFSRMVNNLNNQGVEVIIYETFLKFLQSKLGYSPKIFGTFEFHKDIKSNVDYLLSIGGDGTFLEAVTIVQDANIPIAGINSGHLGFLADTAQNKITEAINDILQQNFIIENRDLIKLIKPNNIFPNFNYALNEISITKKDTSAMIKVHAFLNDTFLNSYWADGLLVATPTGSTAYSLSVGGPILMPNNSNFVISPISPHNLTVRPFVVPNDLTVSLEVDSGVEEFIISLDSRYTSLKSGSVLVVEKAEFKIKMLKRKEYNFYKTLRNKLMWGLDKRN